MNRTLLLLLLTRGLMLFVACSSTNTSGSKGYQPRPDDNPTAFQARPDDNPTAFQPRPDDSTSLYGSRYDR